jgi:MFS family permease
VTSSSLPARWFVVPFVVSLAVELNHTMMLHLPGFLLGIGAREVTIGWLIGMAGAASLSIRPWVGRAIDRHGPRLLILGGLVLLTVVNLSYILVSTVGPLVTVLRTLQGVAEGVTFTALWAFIANRVPEERRTQGLALFGISGLAPIGLGTLAGDVILERASFDLLFLTAAGLSALALAFAYTLRSPRTDHQSAPTGILSLLGRRELRPLWLMTSIFGTGFAVVFIFVKTFVETSGFAGVGQFFVPYAVAAVILRLALGSVLDRLGPKRVVGPGVAAYSIGLLILAGSTTPALLPLAGLVAGSGHAVIFPVLFSLVVGRTIASERGGATAVFTAVLDIGFLAAAPILGLLVDVGGYSTMFVVGAAVLIAGCLAYYRLDRRHDQAQMAASLPALPEVPPV